MREKQTELIRTNCSTGPRVKNEPPPDDDTMMHDAAAPLSPSKRSRSPHDNHEADDDRPGKRAKTEPTIESFDDMDLARMIQEAEASILHGMHDSHDYHDMAPDADLQHAIADSLREGGHDFHLGDIEDLNHHFASPGLDIPDSPSTMLPSKPPDSVWANPTSFTRRKHILPALGSLAIDILITWCEQSLEDTIGTLRNDADSEITREYTLLRSAFETQRSFLSSGHPLLDPVEIGVTGSGREIVRIANLATACTSLFSTNEVEWEELNEYFIPTFVPQGQEMPNDTAQIFLGLKTQMFMATLESEQGKARQQVLDDLFINDVRACLETHHPLLPLSPVEAQFMADAEARHAMLLKESADPQGIGKMTIWGDEET